LNLNIALYVAVIRSILWQVLLVRYWLVRHDNVWRQEISGGYIWTLKRN